MSEQPADDLRERAKREAYYRWVREGPSGRVRAIHGLDETRRLPGIAEVLLEFGIGDTIRPPEDDRARPGFLLVFGDARAQVLERTERALRTLRTEVA
jgi:biotin carboxylase